MMQQRHMLTSHAFEEEAEVEKIAYDTLKRIQ